MFGIPMLFNSIALEKSYAKNYDTSASVIIEMTKFGSVYTCSGVAISDQIILTSAHCMDNSAGNVKILLDDEYKAGTKNYIEIDYYYKHEKYHGPRSFFKYDISILFLKKKLPKTIKPVKIGPFIKEGKFFRVGYGGRNNENKKKIIAIEPKQLVLKNTYLEFKDSDSVIGDSGGPVFVTDNKQISLVGLHSTVEDGQKTYSVNLIKLKEWVDNKISIHKMNNQK